jgi:hypothetical protein
MTKASPSLRAFNSRLQWVVDAFNLLFATSVPAAGSLCDKEKQ